YREKRKEWSAKDADEVERYISLRVIDQNWQGHIDTMSHLRDSISLRSYAQTNPLQDYVNEGYDYFKQMNNKIAHDTALNLMNVRIQRRAPQPAPAPVEAAPAPKAVEEQHCENCEHEEPAPQPQAAMEATINHAIEEFAKDAAEEQANEAKDSENE
ncbi:MAG: hypothetical protein MJ238_03090, partial [Bacilli bacterium]|nr:hypothetical protein [Bacilli bacterium]